VKIVKGDAPARNRPRRRLEARSRAAWWTRCGDGWLAEVVAQGGGALGAAVEADMRSGGALARRGEGKGRVRTLWGAVVTGVAENEEVE